MLINDLQKALIAETLGRFAAAAACVAARFDEAKAMAQPCPHADNPQSVEELAVEIIKIARWSIAVIEAAYPGLVVKEDKQ